MIKRLTLLFTGILGLCASAQNETGQQQKWRESLSSEDFKTRKATMGEIWKEGRKALGFLESLAEGDNPELAARARTILRKVKLGVTPETPENIVRLIATYFNKATRGRKIDTIDKLLAAEEYDILLQLRQLEEDEEVLQRVDLTIAKFLPQIVRNYLNEGNVELAKEYLLLSGSFNHLIHYAHLLDQAGELDAEIARLSQSESKKEQVRYLVCLRVKGDAEMLRAGAEKMGDQDAEILAELNLGNHVPYLQSLLETRNLTPANKHFVDWSLANHQGKVGLQRKIEKELIALSNQKKERDAARMSLLRMGLGDPVLESLGEDELRERVEYLLSHENYVQAQKLIGIPNRDGLDEWLAERSRIAAEELKGNPKSPELERLVLAVRFLEDRGLQEAALKCSRVLFDLIRSSEGLELSAFVSRIFFPAPVCAYHEIAREVERDQSNLKEFLFTFSMDPSSGEWLYGRIKELYPKKSVLDRLLLMASFSARRLFVPLEEFEATRDALIHSAEVKEGDETGELTKILVILLPRNREADLKTALGAFKRIGKENVFLTMAIEVDAGRMQSGGALYENFETPINSSSAEFLYQKGLILKRGGFKGGDELMKKALFLSNGGEESLNDFAMSHLRLGEVNEAYKILRKALLRTEATSKMRNTLISELATEAGVLSEWKEALAYREVAALDLFPFNVNQGVFVMRTRFQILLARGALAMERNDIDGAVMAFSQAHEILPSDGYLANDFFPLLRHLGLIELHDQLFAQSARHSRENIRFFPKDDNAYNNFAWMASRANRCLDEAEDFLKIALKLNPYSAAYLDTMGEIYFARGKREEAVAWSTRSLQNEILGSERSRWELQHQNQRFKTEEFPPK